MAQYDVTLDADLTLNPTIARKFKAISAFIDIPALTVVITYEVRTVGNAVVEVRSVTVQSAAVTTWINNQGTTLMNTLLTKLALTGVIG